MESADPLTAFGPPARTWFREAFDAPTPVQAQGWPVLAGHHNALLIAPTGTGKTLAGFFAAIDRISRLPADAQAGVRTLYISPLKALVYDVERNLRTPLAGVQRTAERLGEPVREVQVAMRTGDTPQRDRTRLRTHPPEILVTTPESLFLILGSRARTVLATVETVIVDEVHALAGTKRGAHLALSLERLAALAETDPQRVGLSATVAEPAVAAAFLGGDREVTVVDAAERPALDLEVTVPVPDMTRPPPPPPREESDSGGPILGELYREAQQAGDTPGEQGIWTAVYPDLLHLIEAHRTTLIFVNSRGLCERLVHRLNELAGREVVRAHHGSVSHGRRQEVEEALKRGELPGIVATSSLELGIDMGAVDLVVLVESPGSVARGLQRVGRAGHRIGEASRGRIFPKYPGDLLEATVVARRMLTGELEPLEVPRNPLDVLAQQVVAMALDEPLAVADLWELVRRAAPYRELPREGLTAVLEMLSGGYAAAQLADLQPLLAWDRAADTLRPRKGTAMLSRMNAGTIPDRGTYAVQLGPDGPRLGELDEEMVHETRTGENIVLGASTWRVQEVTRDRVIVSPAAGEPGKLPFWHGDGPGRPLPLGRALGAFTRELAACTPDEATAWLQAEAPLDAYAAGNLAQYVGEQREATGQVPSDRTLVVERFRDELGDWRICLLSPFGARVHAPWAMALEQVIARTSGVECQLMYTDDGIVLRLPDGDDLPPTDSLFPDPEEVDDLLAEALPQTALFASLFRENAARALLIPRRRPTQRNPLWAQRLKAQSLLAEVQRFPGFPLILETHRQALADIFDLEGLKGLLREIRGRKLRVHEVETDGASSFARSLVFAFVAHFLYDADAPLAERKAQALTLDRKLLSELLGQAELRELIDPEALADVEAQLQYLTEERQVTDADGLHGLLQRLGDLAEDELAARSRINPGPALARLAQERRAARVRIGQAERWIAAQDAGLYRDGLGVAPPPGLPADCLAAAEAPLEQLLRRYARRRGPFRTDEPAARYGLRPAQLEPVLTLLAEQGHLVRGELRPEGATPEWCDAEVLRRIKRETLARLRHEAAPVEAPALGRFLPDWHGVAGQGGGEARLLEVVDQLEGLPLPWSTLHQGILPQRVSGFRAEQLDLLAASGEIVWVGSGALGTRDGRIALYRRERVGQLLLPPAEETPEDPVATTILTALADRGALFYTELESRVRRACPEADPAAIEAALWDLAWAGRITNDTFGPLRGLGRSAGRRGRQREIAGGRWTRVGDLADPEVTDTERALAWAEMLLHRYGIVSREAAHAENLPGGFAAVYGALQGLEDTGRVRRGHFIEGLGGAQFAWPGTVDRLRGLRPEAADEAVPVAQLLAAADPANPYGSLLPWPATGGETGRPRRVAGAWLVLVDGAPALYLSSGGRQLLTFPANTTAQELPWTTALGVLADLGRWGRRGLLTVETVDGVPARESPLAPYLAEAGFVPDYRGLTLERHFDHARG